MHPSIHDLFDRDQPFLQSRISPGTAIERNLSRFPSMIDSGAGQRFEFFWGLSLKVGDTTGVPTFVATPQGLNLQFAGQGGVVCRQGR
jgi:hypothetical protein